ncbi:MAG: hypothetical protein LUH45_05770 [Clostridiales bacterium]|nr:hypothetical protein [Clostridiales bacterium]
MTETLTIINNIPVMLEYFIPGLIFFAIIYALTPMRFKSDFVFCVASVVASVLIKGIISLVDLLLPTDVNIPSSIYLLILVSIAAVLAFVTVRLYRCKKINTLVVNATAKSLYKNLWEWVLDFDEASYVIFHLKSGDVVEGYVCAIEENGDASWVELFDYEYNRNDIIIDNPANNEKTGYESRLLMRMSDVAYAVVVNKSEVV